MTDRPTQQHGGLHRGRHVAVIGGGIGGLTAALAFARQGARVQVFEQADEITEVGAGLQITPNGARVLEALGLADAIEDTGLTVQAVVPMDALSGRQITRFDLSHQQPAYRVFHRATLIDLLARACVDAGVQITLGTRVASVSPQGVLNTPAGKIEADLCIGADGIHAVSRLLMGAAPPQDFTGQVAWRAVVACKADLPVEARIWMAPKRHLVTYPLREGVLNIVAVQERADWAETGWHHVDDAKNLQAAFGDCCAEVRDILSDVKEPRLWGVFRHPVADRWSHGRLAILGDAAHPTLPFLAQGANMAIEDAFVLARCCDEQGDIGEALQAYEGLRKPRVSRAIAAANANARNYHLSGFARTTAHMGLKTLGKVAPNAFINRLSWLYDHDVTE